VHLVGLYYKKLSPQSVHFKTLIFISLSQWKHCMFFCVITGILIEHRLLPRLRCSSQKTVYFIKMECHALLVMLFWSCMFLPMSCIWYSFEHNSKLEEARLKKLPSVNKISDMLHCSEESPLKLYNCSNMSFLKCWGNWLWCVDEMWT
jgi:hypothetical protein